MLQAQAPDAITPTIHKIQLGVHMSNIDYQLCDRMNLVVMPTFNVNLLSTLTSGPVEPRLWSAALSTGIYYGF